LGFAVSLASVALKSTLRFGSPDRVTLPGGRQISEWSPVLLFHAALFYINRVVRRPNLLYSSMAAALILVVLAVEVDTSYVGFSFLVFGALLFEVGLRWRAASNTKGPADHTVSAGDFCLQAQIAAALGAVIALVAPRDWLALALTLALTYFRILRSHFTRPFAVPFEERWSAWGGAVAASLLAYRLIWILIPAAIDRALAFWSLAVILFELGIRRLPWTLRFAAYVTAAVAVIVGGDQFWVLQPQFRLDRLSAPGSCCSGRGQ
jgi:hypothetical protein